MTGPTDLARLVPGFDFLQGLMKNAGASIPGMGQWIAPTLDPAELEKRIRELKTVHFWLEQNARLMGTTIQALEVQRMTLSTLQGMNLPLSGLADALKIKTPMAGNAALDTAAAEAPATTKTAAAKAAATPTLPGAVDPLQWWGALTQQFTELATQAVKDSAADSARSLAGAMVKGSLDSAGDAFRKAVAMPGQAAAQVFKAASGQGKRGAAGQASTAATAPKTAPKRSSTARSSKPSRPR